MTVDVYVEAADKEFLDDIDEIIEATMVEMFILHPRNHEELEEIKEYAKAFNAIFYCAPLSMKDLCDSRCVAYYVDDYSLLNTDIRLPLFIDAKTLNKHNKKQLIEGGFKGIVINSNTLNEELENFLTAIGPSNISSFDMAVLANASMDQFVLQSTYPRHSFEEIFESVKVISNAMLRPEQSIISRATQHSLIIFGFKKAL